MDKYAALTFASPYAIEVSPGLLGVLYLLIQKLGEAYPSPGQRQVTWHCSGVKDLPTYTAIVITQDFICLTPSSGKPVDRTIVSVLQLLY